MIGCSCIGLDRYNCHGTKEKRSLALDLDVDGARSLRMDEKNFLTMQKNVRDENRTCLRINESRETRVLVRREKNALLEVELDL